MGERTRLEYAILSLLARSPLTGNAVSRRLGDLPLGGLGASVGAVYPALYRLREASLVETLEKPRREVVAGYRYGGRGAGAWYGRAPRPALRAQGPRRFRLNRLTGEGRAAVQEWAARPVSEAEMRQGPELLLLRFQVLATLGAGRPPGAVDRSAVAAFLEDYAEIARRLSADTRERLGYEQPLPFEERQTMALLARLNEVRVAWAGEVLRGYAPGGASSARLLLRAARASARGGGGRPGSRPPSPPAGPTG